MNQRDATLKRNTDKAEREKKEILARFDWCKPIAKELREVFGGIDAIRLSEGGSVVYRWAKPGYEHPVGEGFVVRPSPLYYKARLKGKK